MPLILVLGNLRQEDCREFRTSLGHIVSKFQVRLPPKHGAGEMVSSTEDLLCKFRSR